MIIKIFIFWIAIPLTIAIFLKYYLFPYIKAKYTFWIVSKKLKTMAKKMPAKQAQELNQLAKDAIDLCKKTKMF